MYAIYNRHAEFLTCTLCLAISMHVTGFGRKKLIVASNLKMCNFQEVKLASLKLILHS